MVRRKLIIGIFSLTLALAFLAVACGDDDGGGTATSAVGEQGIVRFAFSPDPAWNWIVDNGIEEEMEDAAGFRIIQSITWDEFGVFAGGHADIVSIGSYETPIVESEAGVRTVTIGKFNLAKDVVIVANEAPWTTLADLPAGCKVGVESFVGGATIWQAIARAAHDRDLSEASADLPMATADYQVMPDLVAQGEFCAGIVDPTQAIPYLADGIVKTLYDGKAGSQLYAEYIVPGTGHQGMTSNNWVTLKSWYDTHPEEVAFFLEVWQVALDEWQANRNEIIDTYPGDFSANTPEQTQWMKDYFVNVFDYFVTNTYLDMDWILNEEPIVGILKDVGLVAEGNATPIYVCIDPETGEETCRYPEG